MVAPDDGGGIDLAVGGNLCDYRFREARMPVKTVPIAVMSDDGSIFVMLPCQRHHCCISRLPARAAPAIHYPS
jgi:hypothetical protein